ncbi:hypothetical protein [Streptomyces lichenis]|uniref:Uncharacterized protein n=1 Tax=Streptomyces lichenis TaxID=2306967 RepID=A0ABT0II86_9ACTN|nr:hypothetical protein [Streptomyces lichenis]MCK8680970.1 hypothetical protein [Streptomyces lichenis]
MDDSDRLDDPKTEAFRQARTAGLVCPGDPFDLMAPVIAMVRAWSSVLLRRG